MIVRYADDSVLGFESKADVDQFLEDLKARFAQFGLTLNEDKTRVLQFGRFAAQARAKQGLPKPLTFDFLGFTHLCGKSRSNGWFQLKRLTSAKRMRARLKAIRQALTRRMHEPIPAVGRWLRRVVQGRLLKSTIEASVSMGAVKKTEFERIIVDTTVQEKAIAHPTDSRLLEIARHKVASAAKRCGIALKQTFAKEGKELRRKAGGYAHAKQFRRLRRTVKRQRTILGALMRNARRGLESISQGVAGHEPTALAITELTMWLERAERIRTQERHSKNKLYALHAPEVECIGKGKARKPYEFGVKVSLAVTHKSGLMVGARSFPGNPYDGHTLAEQLEQTNTLLQDIGVKPTTAVVDLGFRGVDEVCAPVQIIHRGKFKSLDAQQRRWLKRRQAIEPAIGHTKSDNRMDRCWLGGSSGDALHAVLCAAGFNIRWLLRSIAAKGLAALLLLFSQLALYAPRIGNRLRIALRAVWQRDRRLESRRYQLVPVIAAEWG